MRKDSYKKAASTRAPVTSIVDQSQSLLQQSDTFTKSLDHQSQSDQRVRLLSDLSYLQKLKAGTRPVQQALFFANNKPQDVRIEFPTDTKRLYNHEVTKTPMLFTVRNNMQQLSASPVNRTFMEVHLTTKGHKGFTQETDLSDPHRDGYSVEEAVENLSDENFQMELQDADQLSELPASTFIGTPHLLHNTKGLFDKHIIRSPAPNRRESASDKYPLFSDTSKSGQSQKRVNIPITKRWNSSDKHPSSVQSPAIQLSSSAIAYIKSHVKDTDHKTPQTDTRKLRRSSSASRPQYSRPDHPIFLKQIDTNLRRLQANKLYTPVLDMLSNSKMSNVYETPPSHFKMVKKRWKVSDPPSLPQPVATEETLPDGIPILTADPHELRAHHITNVGPVAPIPSSSLGFFIEPDPSVSRTRYQLKRVQSAEVTSRIRRASLTPAQLQQSSLNTVATSKIKGSRRSLKKSPPGYSKPSPPEDYQLLTPDSHAQANTPSDLSGTSIQASHGNNLTIDELQPSLYLNKNDDGRKIKGCNNAFRNKATVSHIRSRSSSTSASRLYDSKEAPDNKQLLNVMALVESTRRLRDPPMSAFQQKEQNSRAKLRRCSSACSSSANSSSLHVSGRCVSATASTKASLQQRGSSASSLRNSAHSNLNRGSDVYDRLFANRLAKGNTTEERPLSTTNIADSVSLYKAFNGERPITRGFRARSADGSYGTRRSMLTTTTENLQACLNPGVQLQESDSKVLSMSAVLPTTSLALSMASSYVQSQARNNYNKALLRLHAPVVVLSPAAPKRSTSSMPTKVTRPARRTVGLQSHAHAERSIDATTEDAVFENSKVTAYPLKARNVGYSTRTRNAKIGTVELKDVYTDMNSDILEYEVLNKENSSDNALGLNSQKNVQVHGISHYIQVNPDTAVIDELTVYPQFQTKTPICRSSSSHSLLEPPPVKGKQILRSHSATFHPTNKNAEFSSIQDITTTDILAARRLAQFTTKPYFIDHKRDAVTRHLSSLVTDSLNANFYKHHSTKSQSRWSPDHAKFIKELDIPTIDSPNSSIENDSSHTNLQDVSLTRVRSADGTLSSPHTSVLVDTAGKDSQSGIFRREFAHLLDNQTFSGSSATFEMYIGGLDYQEIDLQHHLIPSFPMVESSTSASLSSATNKKRKVRRVDNQANLTSSSSLYSSRRQRSNSLAHSKRFKTTSENTDLTSLSNEQSQSSHAYSYNNAGLMISDLETVSTTQKKIGRSAVNTLNYSENVLLRRKTPDGTTKFVAINTDDITDNNDPSTTIMQSPSKHLSISAPAVIRKTYSSIQKQHERTNRFNYQTITGKFPLYADQDDQSASSTPAESEQNQNITHLSSSVQQKEPTEARIGRYATTPPISTKQAPSSKLTANSKLIKSYTANHPESLSTSANMAYKAFEKLVLTKPTSDILSPLALDANTSGLRDSPVMPMAPNLPRVAPQYFDDVTSLLEREQGTNIDYKSPLLFSNKVAESPSLRASQEPRTPRTASISHSTLLNAKKDSICRANSIRLSEKEQDLQSSRSKSSQYTANSMKTSYGAYDRKTVSSARQYSRSATRPLLVDSQSIRTARKDSKRRSIASERLDK